MPPLGLVGGLTSRGPQRPACAAELGRSGRRAAAKGPRSVSEKSQMLSFLERGHDRALRIEAEAETLIQHLGAAAFDAARRMERAATDFSSVRYWRSVRKAIERETKIETYRLSGVA